MEHTDTEFSSLPIKTTSATKKSLSIFITKISLLKSELGTFFWAVSLLVSCAFLWDSWQEINDRLFQQSIYFPHCFALISIGTEWFTSGVFSCRADSLCGGGGCSTCIFQHFMLCLEPLAPEFQWSRCTWSEITPWALVICVVSGFISVCKKCFSSSAWGSVCVMLEVLQILAGLGSTERTPSPWLHYLGPAVLFCSPDVW